MQEVRCRKCNKKLAVENDGRLEIINGGQAVRIYGAIAVAIDCNRCGMTTDLPVELRVPTVVDDRPGMKKHLTSK